MTGASEFDSYNRSICIFLSKTFEQLLPLSH